jgi:fucose permease
LKEIFSIKGSVSCFITFFAYCGLEISSSLWTSTYLVEKSGFSPEAASGFASLFYFGMTFGRGINGFLAMRFSDRTLIRAGSVLVALGVLSLFVPSVEFFTLAGFLLIGLGCAPIYPCIIHMTPYVFGRENSQSMIGIQMSFAYFGFLIMPPLFGFIVEKTSVGVLPVYLLILLLLMVVMHELLVSKTRKEK